ncbi:zinc ribbon domain-containing protein [Clostridium ljungdahlii]|uniref:Zinc-ribbon domain-containing protein n=1 Tax=Clostridium ljungdahlii (strain ATCC 55383 / DSM 13528 / PETC) TaxID=748727 RepID=D8GU86_CLOLD|nr:zinc ribbon domain-containing protein [Clostridium ljungdahlii]ADK14749.1 hypothetical protein CLJU_c16850 [Clostridium ljungdahlii DSM 13528]OAA84106.1 hypothetical protein WX45_01950 [Clostridium ljungdahlii DSM 13528]
MICPKCGEKNRKSDLFCSKCGASLEEVNNGEIKPKRFKKRKIFFIIIAIFIIAGVCYGKYLNTQEQHDDYVRTFNETYLSIKVEGDLVESMCSQISSTWHGAIFNSETDFNTAISNLNTGWQNDGSLDERKKAKEDIDKNMSKLKNPTKGYEESYKTLSSLYDDYNSLYQEATNPTGTLMSYNTETSNKENDFNSLVDKLKTVVPNNN